MMKPNYFVFLTFFLLLNTKTTVFAQFPQKENRATAIYSDTIDAIHYNIHLLDINLTKKTIKGYTEIKLISKINLLNNIKLELASLTVDSVFIGGIRINAFSHDGNLIKIFLPLPINAGDTLLTAIYYHGQPYVDPSGWGGFHFSGEYALNLGVGFNSIPHNLGKAWFPCIDDFHDRALYDVYITTTNDKKAISGGLLMNVTDNTNTTSTWHWKTSYTLPTYLISATIGNYELISDLYDGQLSKIPISIYCRPSDTLKTAGTFTNLKNILHVYEKYFGTYPFERIGYTGTPKGLGAMEHAANISYPFRGWTGSTDSEWWYAHELAHMWFGDKVTCASAEDMWLNEGWAVWCESLYREGIYGKQAYKDNMRSKLKDVLQSAHIVDGAYYALYGIPQQFTYGNTVYQKGGQVVHTLREYMGDSLFFGGVKAYLHKYRYNYASTYNLRDFLSEYSGIDMKPFFDAWVFSPGFPHFSIDSTVSIPSKVGYDFTVYVRQKLKGTTHYANSNHLEITFLNKDWKKYTDTIVFSGQTGRKTFHLPFLPVGVMADAEEKISDATTDDIKILKNVGEYDFQQTYSKVIVLRITDSALVRITHNWVAPDCESVLQAGFDISDSRYWTVEGILPAGFKAKGEFIYNTKNGLDNSFLRNSADSLIMLYRPGAGKYWEIVNFVKIGSSNSGSVITNELKRGEYAFGTVSRSYHDNKKKKSSKSFFRKYNLNISESHD